MRDSSTILGLSIRKYVEHFSLTNVPALKPCEVLPFQVVLHHSVSFPPLIKAPPHIGFDWGDVVIGFDHMVLKEPLDLDPHLPMLKNLDHSLPVLSRYF